MFIKKKYIIIHILPIYLQGVLNRLSKLKVTASNYRTLTKMEALGESHDACLQDVRSRITTEKALLENKNKEFQQLHEQLLKDGDRKLISPESINARKEWTELQKSCHPGFVITFDNIDFHLSRRNMSMSEQNRDVHWVNHGMVENRVSGNQLLTTREKDILDIPNIQFLPNVEDQRR